MNICVLVLYYVILTVSRKTVACNFTVKNVSTYQQCTYVCYVVRDALLSTVAAAAAAAATGTVVRIIDDDNNNIIVRMILLSSFER